MGKQALNFRFHNPNSPAETAQMLYRLFIEVGEKKLDNIIANMPHSDPAYIENQPTERPRKAYSTFIEPAR